MKYVMTLILLLNHYTGYNPVSSLDSRIVPIKSKISPERLKPLHNEIESIKQFETFSHNPYRDADGDWLIGYGFKKKFFYKPNYITKSQADSILRSIMTYLYGRAKVNHPKSSEAKLIKIAHVYYWVGISRTLELNLVDSHGNLHLRRLNSSNYKRVNYLSR